MEETRRLREVSLTQMSSGHGKITVSASRDIIDALKASDNRLENALRGKQEPASIPTDSEFKADWIADDALQEKGRELAREKFPEELGQFDIRFLWKQTGGQRNGKATLGKTILPRGFAAFYSKADALIWVAADHLRTLKATRLYLEAVLYHELCHLRFNPEDGLFLIGHDFEGFVAEYKIYGAWRTDLKDLADNLKQLKLL